MSGHGEPVIAVASDTMSRPLTRTLRSLKWTTFATDCSGPCPSGEPAASSFLRRSLPRWGTQSEQDLYEQGSYLTADERMWTAWFETGAFVAAAGLVFVAVALLVGRPGNAPSVTESEPAAREQD